MRVASFPHCLSLSLPFFFFFPSSHFLQSTLLLSLSVSCLGVSNLWWECVKNTRIYFHWLERRTSLERILRTIVRSNHLSSSFFWRSNFDRQLYAYVSRFVLSSFFSFSFFLHLFSFHFFFCHCQCLLDNNNDSRMTQLLVLTDRQMFFSTFY